MSDILFKTDDYKKNSDLGDLKLSLVANIDLLIFEEFFFIFSPSF